MPEEDLHLSDHMRLQAHECGRLARTRCGQDGRAPGAHLRCAVANFIRRYNRKRDRADAVSYFKLRHYPRNKLLTIGGVENNRVDGGKTGGASRL